MYSFIVFKYVNLIIWKKYILVRIDLYFGGIWREADFISGIWGAKAKYFQGAQIFFMDLGRSLHF